MNKVIIVIIICLPLFINAQSKMPIIYDKESYDSSLVGPVKCLEISYKVLSNSEGILTEEERKEFNINNQYIGFFRNTISLFDRKGNLILSQQKDSTNTTVNGTTFYQYDSLNRLIEMRIYTPKGLNILKHIFDYDSLNNWISVKGFELNDTLIFISEISHYANKRVSINRYNNEVRMDEMSHITKSVVEYNNDNSILITHYYDGVSDELREVIKETNYGNKKVIIDSIYFYNHKINRRPYIKTTTTNIKKNKTFYKFEQIGLTLEKEAVLNEHKDLIKEDIYRYINQYTTLYTRFHVSKTFKYECDSHGNYTKKIICKDNIPLIEIDREIEYYE